jgi:hypothetical protein
MCDIVKEPHRRDRLTEGQAARLAEALQRVEGASLPERMGSDATNIRRIEVTIGEARTRLYLDPIVMPTERHGHAEETPEAKLLEIVEIAEELDPGG